MSIELTCTKHPRYMAKREPKAKLGTRHYCETCWYMWDTVSALRWHYRHWRLRFWPYKA